jgi:Rrf2 family cysteine metabolism transcriptional repressor
MRVSLKATYGILACVDLALHEESAPVQARAIAKRQGIPFRFLEQVLHALKQAGVVESLRGAQGGYLLSKRPEELSLTQMLETLDGPLGPTQRGGTVRRGREKVKPDRLLGPVWERVRQAELDVLSRVTLKDLVDRHRELQQTQALMYHI